VKTPIFTVSRKIKVWYGWMEDRMNSPTPFPTPACDNGEAVPDKVFQADYRGEHRIGESDDKLFKFLKGVYDDCFIEIERENPTLQPPYALENTDFELVFSSPQELRNYADIQTGFNVNAGTDTVLLLGADHYEGPTECANGEWGGTPAPHKR